MNNKYDLESLIKTFEEHSIKAEENRKKDLEKFPESEWLKDDFSVTKALHAICKEIEQLKDKKNDTKKLFLRRMGRISK